MDEMKELPGAPVLPEGWFYRVRSSRFGYTALKWTVSIRRPFLYGLPFTYTAKEATVWTTEGTYWYNNGKQPTTDELVEAAKNAYNLLHPDSPGRTSTEGDYR